MRIQRLMPLNVALATLTAQIISVDLPVGLRYHELQLEIGGDTAAGGHGFPVGDITEIRVIANGEVIHRYSGTERDTMNMFEGRASYGNATSGVLVIPFDRYQMYDQAQEESTALQTGTLDPKNGIQIQTLKLELDIAATAKAPTLTITATQSPNVGLVGNGRIRRFMKYPGIYLPVTGENQVSNLPKFTEGNKFMWVNRAHIFSTNITKLTIERDNYRVFERTAALNTHYQTDGVRVPQSNLYVFDPCELGYGFEPLALFDASGKPYSDVRYKPTLSGSETVTFIVEYLGNL